MSKSNSTNNHSHKPQTEVETPDSKSLRRSSAIVQDGILTVPDLARFVSALMADVDAGTVEHKTATLQNMLAGKLLGIANLRARIGILGAKSSAKTPLLLA